MTDWGIIFPGAALAALPMIVFFLLFQRYFLDGASAWGRLSRSNFQAKTQGSAELRKQRRLFLLGDRKVPYIKTQTNKIAIIGAGILGSRHARVFHEQPESETVAIVDVNQERAQKIAALYNAKAYTDSQHDAAKTKTWMRLPSPRPITFTVIRWSPRSKRANTFSWKTYRHPDRGGARDRVVPLDGNHCNRDGELQPKVF